MANYLDSHCHLNDEKLILGYENVLSRAFEKGVKTILLIGWDVNSSARAVEMAQGRDGVYAAVGIHPENLEGVTEDSLREIEELAKNEKVIAIGEIGLDYHWFSDPLDRENQKKWFIAQIELANKLKLPCSIHARDASQDTYDLLKENPIEAGAVLHCYSGSAEMLAEFAKLGYYFGFDGPGTFKNAKTPKECALRCPLDRILTETDSPYMAPAPFRGQTNEPKYIPLIANAIAEIRGMDIEILKDAIERNFERLFHVKPL